MYMYKDTYLELTEDESIKWTIDILDSDGQPIAVDDFLFTCKIAKEFGDKAVTNTYTTADSDISVIGSGLIRIDDKTPNLAEGSYKVEVYYTDAELNITKPKHLYLKVYKKV